MNIRQIGSNQIEVGKKGMRFLVSYETPVAAYLPGVGMVRTEKFYSNTTSKHINRWLDGREAERVSPDIIKKHFDLQEDKMRALIVVDIQNDFCKNGALAVPDGDAVVPVANRIMDKFDLVVATQDWHPVNHKSFRSNNDVPDDEIVGELNGVPQVWWPTHCVQGHLGAEFHPNLSTNKVAAIFRKGMNPQVDSYSGFFDNQAIFNGRTTRAATGLEAYLKGMDVSEVYCAGLATDYCVKYTALDAKLCGFRTRVVADACRGVNLNPGDDEAAFDEMSKAGIQIVFAKDM